MRADDPRRGAPAVCPCCGSTNDQVMGVGEGHDPAGPVINPGDRSVCAYCGAMSVFTGNGLEVRSPTRDEMAESLADPTVREAIRAVVALARVIR